MNYRNFLSLFLAITITTHTNPQTAVIGLQELISHQAESHISASTSLPENVFTSGPEVTLGMLQERFQKQKPAIFIDCHDVFAKRSHSNAWKRFKQNSVPTLFKKTEAAALLLGIAIPAACNSLRLLLTKHNPDGTRTEKRKIGENHFLFIKNWWSLKLYNHFIQYGTDLYSPNEELIQLLYELKAAGHKIYLFSNGGYDTIAAIEQDERFRQYFEGPNRLFSDTTAIGQNSNSINDTYQEEYRIAKPSPDAFEAALKKHGESANYAIFIDDSRSKLADYKNQKITKKYPHFKNFWACSILYDEKKHGDLEETLQLLGVLQR